MDKSSFELRGKRVLITGASSGIGRATAALCARLGAEVSLAGRNVAELEATAALCRAAGAKATIHPGDLAVAGLSAELVKSVAAEGRLDGLVHAAGVCPIAPINVIDAGLLNRAMAVNCAAFLELMRAAVDRRVAGERFAAVAVSSVSSSAGWPGGSAYAATKGALSAAVRSLAIELAPRGFRVNAVCPSNIRTPMHDATAALRDDNAHAAPLGLGEPEQVAAAIAFLLGDAASFVTGVELPVDGGYLAR